MEGCWVIQSSDVECIQYWHYDVCNTPPHNHRSLLQNIVSFIGLFCKRDLSASCVMTSRVWQATISRRLSSDVECIQFHFRKNSPKAALISDLSWPRRTQTQNSALNVRASLLVVAKVCSHVRASGLEKVCSNVRASVKSLLECQSVCQKSARMSERLSKVSSNVRASGFVVRVWGCGRGLRRNMTWSQV